LLVCFATDVFDEKLRGLSTLSDEAIKIHNLYVFLYIFVHQVMAASSKKEIHTYKNNQETNKKADEQHAVGI